MTQAHSWIVTVGIQDDTGEWRERRFEVAAVDERSALEAATDKARGANPYASDVRPYRAEPVSTTKG